jgi:hypothetical protein
MSKTLDLINAIEAQDATAIEASFTAAMAEKVSAKLDDMRMSVAQNMFKEQQVVTENDDECEDDEDEDDEDENGEKEAKEEYKKK